MVADHHLCTWCKCSPCDCKPGEGRNAPSIVTAGPHGIETRLADGRIRKGIIDGGCVQTGGIPGLQDFDVDLKEMDEKREEELGAGADGEGGKRFNKGKMLVELLPPEWIWALADVTTQGSEKYEKRNWEKGMDWSIMIGSMVRHLEKYLAGERYDGTELDIQKGTTGCHHLAMVAWNALALMVYDIREIGKNDLPKLDLKNLNRVNHMTSDMTNKVHENETRD